LVAGKGLDVRFPVSQVPRLDLGLGKVIKHERLIGQEGSQFNGRRKLMGEEKEI
jgi:hypothetical protein